MSEVNNNTTTVSIHLDSALGISNTEGTNLANILNNNLNNKYGIEEITYTNGQLEIKGTNLAVDAMAEKLKTAAFNTEEMKAFLGNDIQSCQFKQNDDGTFTLTTNGVSETKKITDFDIRELMKLLIAAFAELRTADRDRALNVLNAVVAAFETKIEAMETAKEEQFKAAMASAIGQIVSGAASITMSGIGALASLKGPKQKTTNIFDSENTKQVIGQETSMTKSGILAEFLTSSAMPIGKIIDGFAGVAGATFSAAKTGADIEATRADQLLEVLKQAQDQYTKGNDSLQQFIEKVLSIMQQLLQSASQTEKAVANI